MIGIYDCFGYNVSFEKRYKYIKNAGFDSVMLWWSDKFGRGAGYQKDAQYARDAGLIIENIHAPVHIQNALSSNGIDGDGVFDCYIQCIKDCVTYQIPTLVIHLPSDDYPINKLGMDRINEIVILAEDNNVSIAFENLSNISNLNKVFTSIQSDKVGFCYDSCHHYNYAANIDLLKIYGNRLKAIHLHDNGGKNNQHQLPFDGQIEWNKVIDNICNTGYHGITSLEPMNWDYEELSIIEFLDTAYNKAKKLDILRQKTII